MLKVINKMEMIHISEGKDKVYAIKYRDNTRKKSLMFIIQEDNGEYSRRIFKEYDKIQFEDLKVLKQYGQDITEKDIQKISKFLLENWENIGEIKEKNKSSLKETYSSLHFHYIFCKITKNTENVFLKDDYVNFTKDEFKSVMEMCGYSPKEFQEILKENDMLRTNANRNYDFNIKNNGKNVWYISIKLKDLEIEAGYLDDEDDDEIYDELTDWYISYKDGVWEEKNVEWMNLSKDFDNDKKFEELF